MKNIQKLVLVPIEKWEKLGLKEPVKEILVKTVPLKDQSFSEETNFSSEESTGSRNTEKDEDDSSEVSSVISDKEE